jgi:hypothetical protein
MSTDIPVYVSPAALLELNTPWAQACVSLIQDFFSHVMKLIQAGKHSDAVALLRQLKEPNETHLGQSENESKGHALGDESAESVWASLSNSEAAKSGLLKDLEDTVLLVKGVRTDIISDITTNIIREQLIDYTQNISRFYGIPLTPGIVSGVMWNKAAKRWDTKFVELPDAGEFGKLLLVPKAIVRINLGNEASYYYRHYLMPRMQEASENRHLAQLISSGPSKGAEHVTKKALIEEYGQSKDVILKETLKHPDALDEYRQFRAGKRFLPLSHEQVSKHVHTPEPDWQALLDAVLNVPVGREHATAYEDAIEPLLSALFAPALNNPRKQHEINNGRKRIDLTYTNMGVDGLFAWLQRNYVAAQVCIECKNYGKEIGNPDLDQLSGRFSPSFSKVGLLVCRSAEKPALFLERCRDTAKAKGELIVPVYDKDLQTLVKEKLKDTNSLSFNVLWKRFRDVVS